MTKDKKFWLLSFDASSGVGYVEKLGEDTIIRVSYTYEESFSRADYEMGVSLLQMVSAFHLVDVSSENLFFNSINNVREYLQERWVPPPHIKKVPIETWDPKRSLVRYAPKDILSEMLDRAETYYLPNKYFNSALRLAEAMQYAKHADLFLHSRCAQITRKIVVAPEADAPQKQTATRLVALWKKKLEEKLKQVLDKPPSFKILLVYKVLNSPIIFNTYFIDQPFLDFCKSAPKEDKIFLLSKLKSYFEANSQAGKEAWGKIKDAINSQQKDKPHGQVFHLRCFGQPQWLSLHGSLSG